MGNDLQSYAKTLLFRENKLRLGIQLIYLINTYNEGKDTYRNPTAY